MKTFNISVSGETLEDVVLAIEEAKKWIAEGYLSGFNSNDTGDYEFNSAGEYDAAN